MDSDFPYLDEHTGFKFPPPGNATPEGILAAEGNLSPGMLLSAYRQGVFPWYSDGDPLLWWSPDPRFVVFPKELHVSKSLRRILRKGEFGFTVDTCFKEVIESCGGIPRKHEEGTWITGEMRNAYIDLHKLGYAHSVEVWREGVLAGGLYGVSLGSCFFGESMFSRVSNSSKAAFAVFAAELNRKGFSLIDSQVYTAHLESLGGINISRTAYLELLREGLESPTLKGNWSGIFNLRYESSPDSG